MIFHVIGEPEFEASSWYRDILYGLVQEKKHKRIELVYMGADTDFADIRVGDEDVAFVIGSDSVWLDNVTSALSGIFDNRVIVLGNYKSGSPFATYSAVSADIVGNVRTIYEYLLSCGKSRIALYGINPASVSDGYKSDAFVALTGSDALFYNNGSLAACFESFYEVSDSYDAVICVNSYAALSLSRRLADDRIYVASIGTGALAGASRPSITCVDSDYREFARAGIELARMLVKNRTVSSVTVSIEGKLYIGETTGSTPASSTRSVPVKPTSTGDVQFYSDSEVSEMLRIERLLATIDAEDSEILGELILGDTYLDISRRHFISEGTVKYKIKNLCELCSVQNRSELVALAKKYIDP